jgi:hypothetical protein
MEISPDHRCWRARQHQPLLRVLRRHSIHRLLGHCCGTALTTSTVYALHLASLVPRNVAGHKSSVAAIEGFLDRACLPVEIVAFAACVLDALSDGFARRWRDAFLPMDTARLDFYLGTDCWQQTNVSPDLIVLAALALAHGFIDDRGRSNGHWARIEGAGRFDAKEVNRAKRCILEDMDYGLFRISEDMMLCMARKMQQPTYLVTPRQSVSFDDGDKEGRRPRLSLSLGTGSGTAVWAYGAQTPEPSP